jgi:hypothetical protein
MLDDEGKEKLEETKLRIRGWLNLQNSNDATLLKLIGKDPDKSRSFTKRKKGRPNISHIYPDAVRAVYIAKWHHGIPFSNNDYSNKSGDTLKNKNMCIEWAVKVINDNYSLSKSPTYETIYSHLKEMTIEERDLIEEQIKSLLKENNLIKKAKKS